MNLQQEIQISIPKVLAKLGKLEKIQVQFFREYSGGFISNTGRHFPENLRRKKAEYYMCTGATGKQLWFVRPTKKRLPRGGTVARRQLEIDAASKMFRLWNAYEAHEIETIDHKAGYNTIFRLVAVVNEIIYRSEKWDDSARYIHRFDRTPGIYIPKSHAIEAEKGGEFLWNEPPVFCVMGGNLKITKEGITG